MIKLEKIKAIQKALGLEADGIVGPATIEAIYRRVVNPLPPVAVPTLRAVPVSAPKAAPKVPDETGFRSRYPEAVRTIRRFLNLAENDSGLPETDYTSVYLYKDGNNNRKQVTLGIGFTQDGGNLWKVLARYIDKDGAEADFFRGYKAKMKDGTLWAQRTFIAKLKACGAEQKMKDAQDEIFDEVYFNPALAWAESNGFQLPLSYGVAADSFLHSGTMSPRLVKTFAERTPAHGGDEMKWMKAYLEARLAWFEGATGALHTCTFRPEFFLTQIAKNNWQLAKPLTVRGRGKI